MAGTSRFSPRRLLGLIEWLPEGSALVASLRGGTQHRAWPLPTLLAAGQLNLLAKANHQRGGSKGPRPQPVIPPEVTHRPASGGRQTLRSWRRRTVAAIAAARQRGAVEGG